MFTDPQLSTSIINFDCRASVIQELEPRIEDSYTGKDVPLSYADIYE